MATVSPPAANRIGAEVVFQDGYVSVIRITKYVGSESNVSHKVLFAGDPAYEVVYPPPSE